MSSVADRIREFEPIDEDWRPLDELFVSCFAAHPTPQDIDAVFSLFERYPEEDGAGVFWSAVHGLEASGGYEARLKKSLSVSPSSSALALAIRAVNSGDASFLALVANIASHESAPASVRLSASRYVAKKKNG